MLRQHVAVALASSWGRSLGTYDLVNITARNHRCKNVFDVYFILQTFFLFLKSVGKVQSGKQINKKHFQNNSNDIHLVACRMT